MQRVPVHDRREAEILTLENNYHTVVKENKHMDVLLDHLPIGYFRIRLLYDSDGRAIDYLFLSVNRAAQQIVGIAPDAYTDKTAREAGLPSMPISTSSRTSASATTRFANGSRKRPGGIAAVSCTIRPTTKPSS